MENWIKRIFLKPALPLIISSSVIAQDKSVQVIEPEIERQEIKLIKLDAQDFEIGMFYGVFSIEDFDTDTVTGIKAAYHITEDFFFEVNVAESEGDLTSFEELSGGTPILSAEDREYNYYDLNLGWNVLPGEIFILDKYAFNSSLYLIAGVGSTEFAGDDWFTFSYGAGFRLILTDYLAWHIDARDHVFDRDTLGQDETTHNIQLSTGFTFFF